MGVACVIVYCTASRDVLAERIERRNAEQQDPSEATVEVLDAQLRSLEAPTDAEGVVVRLDTDRSFDLDAVIDRIRATVLLAR
jgi:predicted kinase